MEGIREFLKALQQDAAAKELLKNQPKPASDEEAAAVYASIADKMGFGVTKEAILNELKGLEKIQQAKTGEAEKRALDEEMLEQVAGGKGDERCSDTFDQGEWCWFTDSCSYIITDYSGVPLDTPQPGSNVIPQETVQEYEKLCGVAHYAEYEIGQIKKDAESEF